MTQQPFQVVCTSCESILEVRNPELVGQIVACPKCGSMVMLVQVENPPTNQEASQPSVEPPIPEPPASMPAQPETQDEMPQETPDDAEHVFEDTESFCPLAAELHAEYMANAKFDDWQKQRRIIVIVGMLCLLAVFIAFLLLNPNIPRVTPGNTQPTIPPVEIETSPTNEIANDTPKVQSPPTDAGKIEGLPLPPADQIGTENPSELPDAPLDNPQNTVATQTDPAASTDNTTGTSKSNAVRVTPLQQGVFIDPFGDLDNVNDTDNPPDETDDNTPGHTETTVENNGLTDIWGNAKTSSEPTTTDDDGNDVTTESELATDDDEVVMRPEVGVEPGDITGTLDSLRQGFAVSSERPKIDITERLQQPVTSIRFEKAAIIDIVRAISDLSGVPMQLDIDELRARGVSVESPVSLQLQETTLAGIIEATLQKTRLSRHDGDNCVVFGYPDEQVTAMRTVRYDMSQLASLEQNPISVEQATQWLSQLLLPPSQNPNVRDAAVAVDGNEIVVVGTSWLQDQARRLLLTLFYLRELEPETKLTPERLAPEVFGWDRVNTPMSFNPVEPLSLKRAAWLIEQHTKVRLLIDHAALHEDGFSQETPVTCHVSNGTIDTVLREMLEPLGLTYRIVEVNAVEITTPDAAKRKMTIEAQHYSPLPADKTPESIAETIRQAFGGNTRWNDETGGVIVIDEISGYMLVRQSQPLQRDIRLWFGRMHSEENPPDTTSDDAEIEVEE